MQRTWVLWILGFTLFAGPEWVLAEPADGFTIRADWFDRGNVRVSRVGQAYADRFACIWNAGPLPNQVEYDLEFPVPGTYQLVVLYTAAAARPVDIYLNGERLHQGLSGVTGSWQTSQAHWESQVSFEIGAGMHTLRLVRDGPFPHIVALRLESASPFPDGWRLQRAAARAAEESAAALPDRARHLLMRALQPGRPPLERRVVRGEIGRFVGPAAHNELLQRTAAVATSPWVAELSWSHPDGRRENEVLNLCPHEIESLLQHALTLIDDFRNQPEVPPDYLQDLQQQAERLRARLPGFPQPPERAEAAQAMADAYLDAFRIDQQVMAANPLLDFERLLLVRRSQNSPALGLPQNWQGNCVLPRRGYDNQIAVLEPVEPGGKVASLYEPAEPVFVGDLDLHFDGQRLLFSSIGTHNRWHVFELTVDGQQLRQLTPADLTDVDHYDACYLPDERIVFSSTATLAAVPCVDGSTRVANLYRMEPHGSGIRQLCYDQDHNWSPRVLPSGRVLFQRWEYTDTPHSHTRLLFSMNPDGTSQMEHYGSNSYWPNALFYARPIPQRPTQFVAIVGGHHGVRRKGELVLFDVARGRHEVQGVIQRIPGRGQPVEAKIEDNLVDDSWPKFLHPYPLNDSYFLVAMKPTPESLWGIYLVDVFDGALLLAEEPGYALLEPLPVRRRVRPPVIPDRYQPGESEATIYMADVHAGEGLRGVPRGEVKRLRVFSYHYLYPNMGGPQGVVGMEGPWDIKRILGTVPVAEDGSALFRVPANTPISIQPLDREGKALQLMRSWMTAMPGEVLSCVGCHEGQNSTPPPRRSLSALRPPDEIEPWYGPPRGFNFAREVQPVLDRYCLGCHDGQPRPDQPPRPSLRGDQWIDADAYTSVFHHGKRDAGHFTEAYAELHRWVRRPGLESDYHLLMPMEFHADTTQLVKMLRRGHHGVQLDQEAWDRLITWIDLNAPFHGTWTEIAGAERVGPHAARRRELQQKYGGGDQDPEAIVFTATIDREPLPVAPPAEPDPDTLYLADWPLDAEEARRRQQAHTPYRRSVDLGDGVQLELVRIPAGPFIMGDLAGFPDERPRTAVQIEQPFWMGTVTVTNKQFARFDPTHDSRVESRHAMQFGVRGFYVNGPRQPVVRVSWQQANAFCQWLSEQTGESFRLPSEAEWEYASRAGTDTAFFFGDVDSDYSAYANLADQTLAEFVCHPYKKDRQPFPDPGPYDDWIPRDDRFRDGGFVSEDVGSYRPNPWQLNDVHGNVWEWTRTAYRPYPYDEHDGRNEPAPDERRVVRGGSWRNRPRESRAAARLAFRPYQGVFHVGFRVVADVETSGLEPPSPGPQSNDSNPP